MATYPIKMLKDEEGKPFVPLINIDAIKELGGDSLMETIEGKLEVTNIIAGRQIDLDIDGNNITINNSSEGTKLINNLDTTASGTGALDAAQGKVLKDSIPEVINNLTTIDSKKALSAHQGYILAGRSVPVGGGTGQVLMKSADDDYSLTWGDAADPNAIVGDGSIKKIVELTYEEYTALEDQNNIEPTVEYHINNWNENERTYLKESDILTLIKTNPEFTVPIHCANNFRAVATAADLESNVGASHPTTGDIYLYANDMHHGIYSSKWGVLVDASDEIKKFRGTSERAIADENGNNIVTTYQPKIYDSGWIYPTLQNGWVAYDDSRPFKYRKIGEVVYIQGSIKDGTHRSVVCTLPAGFRPGVPYSNCPIRINGTTVGWFFVNYGGSELNGVVAIESSKGTDDDFVECPMFSISYIAEA